MSFVQSRSVALVALLALCVITNTPLATGVTANTTSPSPAAAAKSPATSPPAKASGVPSPSPRPVPPPTSNDPKAMAKELAAFMRDLLPQLMNKTVASSQADWTKQTNITAETSAAAQKASSELLKLTADSLRSIVEQFRPVLNADSDYLDPETSRQLHLFKVSQVLPPPASPEKQQRLAKLAQEMEDTFANGQWCHIEDGHDVCLDLDGLQEILKTSREPEELLQAWLGWRHAVGPKLKEVFPEFVDLANEGAKTVGFIDVGALWRSGYDMPDDRFEREVTKLWDQVKPLYEQLHCYTRHRLAEYPDYKGKNIVRDGFDQFIPAHLLRDMWGQDWLNMWDILDPHPGVIELDATPALKDKNVTEIVKIAEDFFTSLGLDPLPQTFWERSLFEKPPPPRRVVCHASAWDVNFDNDLRLKACFGHTEADLITAHHELGHLYYFHEYYDKNVLYQNGANDGFHEAIGDTISLSVTPDYLVKQKLLKPFTSSEEGDINILMKRALSKVAFLPFGMVIDKWRWDVFSGKVEPKDYNDAWWLYKQQFQGVMAPVKRNPAVDFDPGAKYHVAANVPYIRYFLAAILQFQFHEALCKEAGHVGELHKCSVYGSKAAGDKLKAMLKLGASRPWQDALFEIAGTRDLSADPLLDYFKPLLQWLTKQNEGLNLQCGWPTHAPVEPQNVETHMGKFIGIAIGCVCAIFVIALLTNWYQRTRQNNGNDPTNPYEEVPVARTAPDDGI